MDEENVDVDFRKRAEDELNETPENVRLGIDALKRLILGKAFFFIFVFSRKKELVICVR